MNDTNRPKQNKQLFQHPKLHRACLCLGSNIEPEANIQQAVALLKEMTNVEGLSNCYETSAVGSDGPNFLNMAACLLTTMDSAAIKGNIIQPIEQRLGRVRQPDKNAPRTIDLDLIVYDYEVLDPTLWQRVHLALPFSELVPDLVEPESGKTLKEVAERLAALDPVIPRPEIVF